MDVVFGDTAAHEEKARLYQIAEQLQGGGGAAVDEVLAKAKAEAGD